MKQKTGSKKLQLNKLSLQNLNASEVYGGISGGACLPAEPFSNNPAFTACSSGDKPTRNCVAW
jgi:hypothetical protein